jgi:hypothetical protein
MSLAHTSNTVRTRAIQSQRARRDESSVRTMFRRLLAAVVQGSDHPCWRTDDAWTQLAVLPHRYQSRFLDSGRVTTKR